MWSDKYNPMTCFDALYSSSEGLGLENLEHLGSSSGSRIELPGGGFIDLPGIETPPEQDEQMFHSDIFQDYGLLDEPRSAINQDHVTTLFSKIQSLEINLAQKDQVIIQQESENTRLREHLNRLMQIVTDRNLELHNLRNEASGAIRELHAWGTQLGRENKCFREELVKKEVACAEMFSEVQLVPLLRRMLEEGKNERIALREKLDYLDKSIQDLTTKNSILEHELTIIPKMLSRANSKSFVKAEVHKSGAVTESNAQPSARNVHQCCSTAVREQKTSHFIEEEDPEQIVVLRSQFVATFENRENVLKKVKQVLSPKKWRRNKTSKTESHRRTDSRPDANEIIFT